MSQHRLEHTYKGRTWVAVGREPYTRLDGTVIELVRWQTPCARCEAIAEIKTPVDYGSSKAFAVKHCAQHRMTWGETQALAKSAKQAKKEAAE
jgi:hypothetical protein